MKKKSILFALAAIMIVAMAGCGASGSDSDSDSVKTADSYKDGTYTGRSEDHEEDEDGNGSGYGEIKLELKDNKVVSCTFTMYELDGTVKDETYGADLSQENRLKAQKAVQSCDKYAAMLLEQGTPGDIDTVSGATISHSEFVEALNDALSQAAN